LYKRLFLIRRIKKINSNTLQIREQKNNSRTQKDQGGLKETVDNLMKFAKEDPEIFVKYVNKK